MGSRSVEGWDGWGQWQLSTAETRTDWRSDHPVVLDVPSAAIFSLRRARAAQQLTCDFVDGGGAAGCCRRELPFLLSRSTARPAKRFINLPSSQIAEVQKLADHEML